MCAIFRREGGTEEGRRGSRGSKHTHQGAGRAKDEAQDVRKLCSCHRHHINGFDDVTGLNKFGLCCGAAGLHPDNHNIPSHTLLQHDTDASAVRVSGCTGSNELRLGGVGAVGGHDDRGLR